MKALIPGGYFDGSGECVVWQVDFATERAEVALRWTPPELLRVPTKGFAGGCLGSGRELYVAAHAAVVRIDTESWRVSGVLHQPCMNDLHHVALVRGRLHVANTGLEAVDVFGLDGSFLGSHALNPGWATARRLQGQDPPDGQGWRATWEGQTPRPWAQSSTNDGYHSADRTRPFHMLKVPDRIHVNHVAQVGQRLVATCFRDGTLRDLQTFEILAHLQGHYLHDGVESDGSFWLTCIDGTVLELDPEDLSERSRLQAFDTGHYGWCRGLAVTSDYLVVGLTEVRRGRLPRHRWAALEPEESETSVLLLDRSSGRLRARVDLTDRSRHAKIYSVLLDKGDA